MLPLIAKRNRVDTMSTAKDMGEMATNRTSTGKFTDLDPPQQYRTQYGAFRSAFSEMHISCSVANNSVFATPNDFDAYRRHVDEAADFLRSSNKMLGQQDRRNLGIMRFTRVHAFHRGWSLAVTCTSCRVSIYRAGWAGGLYSRSYATDEE